MRCRVRSVLADVLGSSCGKEQHVGSVSVKKKGLNTMTTLIESAGALAAIPMLLGALLLAPPRLLEGLPLPGGHGQDLHGDMSFVGQVDRSEIFGRKQDPLAPPGPDGFTTVRGTSGVTWCSIEGAPFQAQECSTTSTQSSSCSTIWQNDSPAITCSAKGGGSLSKHCSVLGTGEQVCSVVQYSSDCSTDGAGNTNQCSIFSNAHSGSVCSVGQGASNGAKCTSFNGAPAGSCSVQSGGSGQCSAYHADGTFTTNQPCVR